VPTVSHVPPLMLGLPLDDGLVILGLVTCARVTAALVIVFVFGGFRLNGNPPVRQFGVGLTVAVILEVTAVR
jgi:RND superfamily putative drug exporter